MRRLGTVLMLVLLAAGCRPNGVNRGNTGAETPQMAVVQFLNGARAQDLQAMSAYWGDEDGLTREREGRSELERRLIILACHLNHEESRISEPKLGEAGRVVFTADITKGGRTATIPFTTAKNRRDGRWYVAAFDYRSARPFCTPDGMTRR